MQQGEFDKIKEEFENSNISKKIKMYVQAKGLSQAQYKELLQSFPLDALYKLEEALR